MYASGTCKKLLETNESVEGQSRRIRQYGRRLCIRIVSVSMAENETSKNVLQNVKSFTEDQYYHLKYQSDVRKHNYFNFSTNPCIFSIAQHFRQRLQFIFRQIINLINHNTIQWSSRWNMSNRMLSEEKSKRSSSMLMSSQGTMLLLYPVMHKCRYPVWAYSNISQ